MNTYYTYLQHLTLYYESQLAHLDKTHPNGAHFGELIHCLKSMIDRLGQKLSKLLIVKNFETAATRNLTDSGGMKVMVEVAVPALHKYAAVTETLGIYLPANIVEMNTLKRQQKSAKPRPYAGCQRGKYSL